MPESTASTDPMSAQPPVGPPPAWDLVTVPVRQGLEAVDILRRSTPLLGPVVHDGPCETLGFVVPEGTARGWDVPGSTCTQTNGRGLRLAPEPPVAGAAWLLPPRPAAPHAAGHHGQGDNEDHSREPATNGLRCHAPVVRGFSD